MHFRTAAAAASPTPMLAKRQVCDGGRAVGAWRQGVPAADDENPGARVAAAAAVHPRRTTRTNASLCLPPPSHPYPTHTHTFHTHTFVLIAPPSASRLLSTSRAPPSKASSSLQQFLRSFPLLALLDEQQVEQRTNGWVLCSRAASLPPFGDGCRGCHSPPCHDHFDTRSIV